ncbi:hypothetical protein LTR57_009500 [Friedmanniomyces endolithicus]|nr:hypothetical protein LTR94_001430 [Friedmanniomyces endolithicus]KAK0784402.1 hypothetical protein LTR75_013851 [Friedmanniomyces endolithicus]KAK0807036.1 hypothetical protein LTR59_003366 [Friedmanniomyces endolithicus]KAK0818454.1 hypothetical protein LTR38_001036 [Friedmanniomyces endolithicus]KAK0920640.1 hypothetical protein LTR57_009500 [Friedmanniomyces endolithicus]
MAQSSLATGLDIEMKTPYHHSGVAMADSKGSAELETGSDKDGWGQDVRDMHRLGKKQEFTRNFGMISALGFVSIYMATWEFVLVSLSVGLANGGFGGLFWCFITTAPPQYQKVLSYASGWMSTLGWIASLASSVYVCGTQIQAMINVLNPDEAMTSWQLTLVMFAIIAITIVFNTVGAKFLPMLETISLFGHIAGFFVVMIPLLVLCPKNSAYDVFVHFEANGGWSLGPAYLVSQVTIIYCNLGSDSVVHISEEVEDASLVVPRHRKLICPEHEAPTDYPLITRFCIGPLEDVVNSSVPYVLLFNNTGSPALSIVLNLVLFLLVYSGNVTALATSAREMWAFARDHGLPGSGWLGRMDRKCDIPFNAVYGCSAGCVILALIQLGSTLAFNIIVSLSVLGLMSTYMLSIGGVFLKRLKGEPLPYARWSLGRFGFAINGFALFYSAFLLGKHIQRT